MVDIEIIDTGAPKAGPYSLGLKVGNLIFISGQVPDREANNIKEQTLSALEKIKKVLMTAKSDVRSIVKIGVYLKSMDDFQKMNEAYKEFFEQNGVSERFPTRTTIEAKCPLPTAEIEIDAIAVI